ncbi:MAG: hypothetical protein IH975_12175 [Nitrospinae bacterium]|nr:hypothetical protein [Nitrospinota bacterium]
MRSLYLGLTLALTVVAATACAPSVDKLQSVKPGMTKKAVTESFGQPTTVKAVIRNRFGQTIEVWEYNLALPDDPSEESFKKITATMTAGVLAPVWLVQNTKPYWFYFLDSKFAKWREAGDWEAEMEQLLEHRLQAQAP